jgi:hypothetical protein
MTVYLLHFAPRFRHARHYIGFTPDDTASRRIVEHLRGQGSPMVRGAVDAGCEVLVPHVWTGAPREFERWLKHRRDTARWCPCAGCAAWRQGRGERALPLPTPDRMTAAFLAAKPDYPTPSTTVIPAPAAARGSSEQDAGTQS